MKINKKQSLFFLEHKLKYGQGTSIIIISIYSAVLCKIYTAPRKIQNDVTDIATIINKMIPPEVIFE